MEDVQSFSVLRLLRLGHHFKQQLPFCDILLSCLLFTEADVWSFCKFDYFVGQIWCTSSERVSIGTDNEMITTYEQERMVEKAIVV